MGTIFARETAASSSQGCQKINLPISRATLTNTLHAMMKLSSWMTSLSEHSREIALARIIARSIEEYTTFSTNLLRVGRTRKLIWLYKLSAEISPKLWPGAIRLVSFVRASACSAISCLSLASHSHWTDGTRFRSWNTHNIRSHRRTLVARSPFKIAISIIYAMMNRSRRARSGTKARKYSFIMKKATIRLTINTGHSDWTNRVTRCKMRFHMLLVNN